MIRIRRIKPDEVAAAKRLIYRVAREVYRDTRSLEGAIAYLESRRQLQDMDDIQQSYFNSAGIFLITTDEKKMIGTGAIRKIDDGICELKRLWLLSDYHGRGLGYRMVKKLLSFARGRGYGQVRLETDPVYQKKALNFYVRLGFYEIPRYSDHMDDIAMELIL